MPEQNPCGPATKPADCETATDNLERAYARHSGTASAPWLPPGVCATAADKAAVAAAGVALVDEITKDTTSFETKVQKVEPRI